ncbi:hypothetical protein OW763_04985 [Clostridium aestuarii]|uniref:Small, acid-soluble spore protein, alpha/beta type n=1 Tax=Clostridium aestuarii TaxID=338193 RepID=A0ABT4CXX0_9CLOT|nr:hypothetical protein [Clostridium aestuarii]MCY6483702.1 hypothetical protein [Clostridium aestuarii]
MINTKIKVNLSKYQIEMKAREYGMEYKDEQKVIKDKNLEMNNQNISIEQEKVGGK